MPSTSAGPSIVRSVRQRQLLNAWLRLFARQGGLPAATDYEIDRLDDERPDMMIYAVTHDAGMARYKSTFEGQRMIDAFNASAQGRFLDEVLGPERAAMIIPIYDECVRLRRPSYTIRRVADINGRQVDYERLLLPFGSGEHVETLIASLKGISVDGGFEQKDLMRSRSGASDHFIHAIIDRDRDHQGPRGLIGDNHIEI